METLPLHLRVCNLKGRTRKVDQQIADRNNAFTIKSYKKDPFFSIGKPLVFASPNAITSYRVSQFRKKLLKNDLPFNIDYSSNRLDKLVWKEPIQALNLSVLLPVLIEGFFDSEKHYHQIIFLALEHIIQHSSIHQVMSALPHIRKPFADVLHSQCKSSIISGLKAIRLIVDITRGMKETVTAVFRELLIPLNKFYSDYDETVDEQVRKCHSELMVAIDITLNQLETMGGNWRQQLRAFRDIKKTCALYDSAVFPTRLMRIDRLRKNCIIRNTVSINPSLLRKPIKREKFYPQIRLYDMNFV